jgi:hypothetical protein
MGSKGGECQGVSAAMLSSAVNVNWFFVFASSGQPVFALWRDKHYYPAVVLSTDGKKQIHVKFNEDGSTLWVRPDKVICCEVIPVGFDLMALRIETEWSEAAVVRSYYTDSNCESEVAGYSVQFYSDDSIAR